MTGWPWPLDGVQNALEGLFSGIFNAINTVGQWVYDNVYTPIANTLTNVWNAVVGAVNSAAGWIWDRVSPILSPIWDAVKGATSAIWSGLSGFLSDPVGTLSAGWNQITGALGGVWNNIVGAFNAFGSWVNDNVAQPIMGGIAAISSWVADALSGVAAALGGALTGFWNWFVGALSSTMTTIGSFVQTNIVSPIMGALQWIWDQITGAVRGMIEGIMNLFKSHSPIRPEEALGLGILGVVFAAVSGMAITGILDVGSLNVLGTGLDLKGVSQFITRLIDPGAFVGAVVGVLLSTAIRTPLTYFYNKLFRPRIPDISEAQSMLWRGKISVDQFKDICAMSGYSDEYVGAFEELTHMIPSSGDLIRFVVREVIPPTRFYEDMKKQGFSEEYAHMYWDAHWVLPAFEQLVDAMHRGIISAEELNKFIVWHDYAPDARPGISVSDLTIMRGLLKTLIPRVDLRRAWEYGVISDEELEKRYRWLGFEEDAPIMADMAKRVALESEITALRTEALSDYREGLLDKETLRTYLEDIGTPASTLDYYLSKADFRMSRDRTLEQVKLLRTRAIKGAMTTSDLRRELGALGIKAWRINQIVDDVELRRKIDVEEVRTLTATQVLTAYKRELRTKEWADTRLKQMNYADEDRSILLELYAPKAPEVTQSEELS